MKEDFNKDPDLAKEMLTILSYLDDTFTDKLPDNLILDLTSLAADSNKEYFIDKNKSLAEQNISNECKNWLSLLYYENMDEDDRKDIYDNWVINDFMEE